MHLSLSIPPSCTAALFCAVVSPVWATETADLAFEAFKESCFNPHLTATTATQRLAQPGTRVQFYDLNPFSASAPSPVTGRAATPGTDRRCEVAFDGDFGAEAATTAVEALEAERILNDTPLPVTHTNAHLPGTTLLAARNLNPKRIAIVHTGTRPGPNGAETFLLVERLTPEASAAQN